MKTNKKLINQVNNKDYKYQFNKLLRKMKEKMKDKNKNLHSQIWQCFKEQRSSTSVCATPYSSSVFDPECFFRAPIPVMQ